MNEACPSLEKSYILCVRKGKKLISIECLQFIQCAPAACLGEWVRARGIVRKSMDQLPRKEARDMNKEGDGLEWEGVMNLCNFCPS